MATSIVKLDTESITLQVTIPFSRSMINSESAIQDAVNEVGSVATKELLKTFDTNGEDIVLGSVKLTSKGLTNKYYQTPYGEVDVSRHTYQTNQGGATFCPLEREARIILASTPRFASQVSHKMAEMSAPQVLRDFLVNNNRKLSISMVQRLSECVSSVVQIKEEDWSYSIPNIKEDEVKTVGIGLDGTCMLMCEGAYRQAMVGTIALYNAEGDRLYTTYVAATPEYGKDKFKERLIREIERTKELYPNALKIGIADGAPDNWSFLEKYTNKQTLDFYHATEYLTDVADEVFISPIERKKWLNDTCHKLKHEPKAAEAILKEMEEFLSNLQPNKPKQKNINESGNVSEKTKKQREQEKKTIEAAVIYYKNNIEKSRMNYFESVALNHVIGSGITEAACKTIIKQRLCSSGMRWKDKGAGVILSLRTLIYSSGRWDQFWKKINQYGFPVAV